MLLVRDLGPIRDDAEHAVRGRQHRGGDPVHEPLGAHPVADDVGHRDDRDAVLPREREEVGHAGHGAVLVHDLADDGRGRETRDAREVDRGLRLSGPLQDAALAGAQGKRVTGAQEVLRLRLRVDEGLHRRRPVGRRDPGRRLAAGLDGNREGRPVVRRVLLDHRVEVQLVATLLRERDADETAPLTGHEIDSGGGDVLGREAEVAFVLAVFVVDDDDEAAFPVGGRGLRDRNESQVACPFAIGHGAARRPSQL